MTGTAVEPDEELTPDHLVASPDRRFYAFVLDRLLGWAVSGAAVWAVLTYLDGTLVQVLAIAGAVVVVWAAFVVLTGVWGATPGKAAVGLRVLSAEDARPIGVARAALRGLVVGVLTLPFLGFGAAALAWTALVDPSGWRRGWHDLRTGSVVVDVRPPPPAEPVEEEAPRGVVNLTAMRLVPASPTPPRRIPTRGAEPPADPPAPTRTPRRGLGWPLVGARPEAAPAELAQPAATPVAPAAAASAAAAAAAEAPAFVRPPAPPASPSSNGALPAPPAERTRPQRPAAAVPARWQVAFDTGETFEVDGLTLVGRRPEPRDGEPVRRLVELPSEDMSLSKTHAQFQVVPDGALVVMDRGSTNGSLLVRDGVVRQLAGGRPATLRDGDRVRFGDREMGVTRLS